MLPEIYSCYWHLVVHLLIPQKYLGQCDRKNYCRGLDGHSDQPYSDELAHGIDCYDHVRAARLRLASSDHYFYDRVRSRGLADGSHRDTRRDSISRLVKSPSVTRSMIGARHR